ncbi:MAG: histidine kinase N-terminal domain-containing protein, partial [Aldersonia sp.]|nr:histidine kinase N-terminal domain-containing protein [Aldersonia sp.]
LLWVGTGPVRAGGEVVCVAQCRPTTAPTVMDQDLVGTIASESEHPQVIRALAEKRVLRAPSEDLDDSSPTREAVPVRCGDDVIAVLSRDTNLARSRARSTLELAYLACADDLCQMISEGTYPTVEDRPASHSSPRAGDGFIRLDTEGRVVYASPNAQSAYHRMGIESDLSGQDLAAITRTLITDPFDAQEAVTDIKDALAGKAGRRMEVDAHGATVLLRTLALQPHGESAGAAVLVRDVTEVKRRDRALLSKDATIREIHHRVKNNLQTVAALLRLQARRTENEEARVALNESVRRVTAIAAVHDMLSMSVDEEVDLDEVVDRLLPMMADVSTVNTSPITVRRDGSLGVLAADRATPLVMVLTELVQNAIEHAFEPGIRGSVTIRAERSARWLDVVINDDGRGLPNGFSLERSDRLGLQIVRTLVNAELGGSIGLHPGTEGGTDAVLRVPLGRRGTRS